MKILNPKWKRAMNGLWNALVSTSEDINFWRRRYYFFNGYQGLTYRIKNASLEPDDIDFIVFATPSPDYYFPDAGVLVQEQLGLKAEIGALDVRNQCSGFIYALSVADQFIKTGMYKNNGSLSFVIKH